MQNAAIQSTKDTFYTTLRDRLATLNPARTVVVRSTTRPGVLVEENELASATELPDCFRMRWTSTKIDPQSALPLITLRCEIAYATDGNAGNGGMDRGRMLAAIDAELANAIAQAPQNAAKLSYNSDGSATILSTRIFWSDATFNDLKINGERLERTATVDVFSYQEAGER
jgi:hypothetical protein